MRSSHLSTIAHVRFLAGALGERAGWWTSQFTQAASRSALERLFPRTASRAALGSVVEAARRAHDAQLGPGSYHLFRLPVHLEDRLAGWLADGKTPLDWPPLAEDALLVALDKLAGKAIVAVKGPGPLRLGVPKQLDLERTFREIAAAYRTAAAQSVQVLPYFED
ncbi:BrxE family protein [Polyangium sp. 15x6]|uniref:BrxE family protein n=1 Tax=Polyangium sp. 15x6 TaxID=3042687 RepID=UPI00249C086D|nr:BrxE family protein [Polyangium sp. 15x6]MDI3291588.1 BrxE family protein [Polyangium sp. 15x6]